MKRHIERRFVVVAAHSLDGKRALALPGDEFSTSIQRRTELSHELVREVSTNENRPAAEIQRRDVA